VAAVGRCIRGEQGNGGKRRSATNPDGERGALSIQSTARDFVVPGESGGAHGKKEVEIRGAVAGGRRRGSRWPAAETDAAGGGRLMERMQQPRMRYFWSLLSIAAWE
jgi:hypothetical protein